MGLLEGVLERLQEMPRFLESIGAGLPEPDVRRSGPGGSFSLVEHAWHLADLEREGFGARIRRLRQEAEPHLADFDGQRAAQERQYGLRSLDEGVAVFSAARATNLAALRSVTGPEWERTGVQAGIGPVRLRDVPRLMLEHDLSHREEIQALLERASAPASRQEDSK